MEVALAKPTEGMDHLLQYHLASLGEMHLEDAPAAVHDEAIVTAENQAIHSNLNGADLAYLMEHYHSVAR